MAEFDHGIKQITDTTARELARVARLDCTRMQPREGTLPATTELLADRAFRARRGRERFIVYFEFYTYWDRNAPWDMLAKSGLLSQRLHLPTVCVAFVLRPRGFRFRNEDIQDFGWKQSQFRHKTIEVGRFPAKAWGLYDMHGNVWKWCQDWFGPYPASDVVDTCVDPQADGGGCRVVRGGSWGSRASYCRAACRIAGAPDLLVQDDVGCRVVLCLD